MRLFNSSAVLVAFVSVFLSFLPINAQADGHGKQQGGIYLLLDVALKDAYVSYLDDFWPDVRDALAAERDTVGFVMRQDSNPAELRVRITKEEGAARALEIVRGLVWATMSSGEIPSPLFDVRMKNTDLTIRLSQAGMVSTDEATMQRTLNALEQRLSALGNRAPLIARQGADQIALIVFGIGASEDIIQMSILRTHLAFHTVVAQTQDTETDAGIGNIVLPSREEPGEFYIVERAPIVTGDDFMQVDLQFDQLGRPAVGFVFSQFAADAFGAYTAANIGRSFAIVLNDEVISAPIIRSHIPGGRGLITADFTVEEATKLVNSLKGGSIPVNLSIVEERIVGPPRGTENPD